MTSTADSAARPIDLGYRILSGDDSDERLCAAIPDSACRHQPRNFVLNVANGSATKLAEQLAGPELVLPWLLTALGTPAAVIGWLVPLKQTGSLLPQLAAAAAIRGLSRRKWAWVGAGAVQALCLLLMIPAILLFPPLGAGLAVLALFGLFSVASGVGSVAFQDVTGKTVDRGMRGRMLSLRASIGGALTLVAAAILQVQIGGFADVGIYLGLVAIAALLWLLGSVAFAAIAEEAGETGGGRNALAEVRRGLGLIRREVGFRWFLGARVALLSIELAVPFYAMHAHDLFSGDGASLGSFLFAVGLANVLSSPIWGRMSDASSRDVMMLSALLAAAAALVALGLGQLPREASSAYLYTAVFFLIGLAVSGVRLGRKTYLLDAAPDSDRPLYVAFSNTAIGVVTLVGGALGFVATVFGIESLIALLLLLSLAAAAICRLMPKAEEMASD